ncbi:Peptidyl-prolyl cis-trans isomerase [Nymphaea thermarum]|nr:Peptidyl-prolyl cis-trans isomerase [Nymphaea thermarum]
MGISKTIPIPMFFGEVAEGFDTLTRINEAFVEESTRPFKNIRFSQHTYILDEDDPFDDPPQSAELIPHASPEGKPLDEPAGLLFTTEEPLDEAQTSTGPSFSI